MKQSLEFNFEEPLKITFYDEKGAEIDEKTFNHRYKLLEEKKQELKNLIAKYSLDFLIEHFRNDLNKKDNVIKT